MKMRWASMLCVPTVRGHWETRVLARRGRVGKNNRAVERILSA